MWCLALAIILAGNALVASPAFAETKMAQSKAPDANPATSPKPAADAKPATTVSLKVVVSNPHSAKSPESATVVVKDKDGKVVAQGVTKLPDAETIKSDPGQKGIPSAQFDLPVGTYTVETKFTSDSDTKYEGKVEVKLVPENRTPSVYIDAKLVNTEEQKPAEDKTGGQNRAPDKTATGVGDGPTSGSSNTGAMAADDTIAGRLAWQLLLEADHPKQVLLPSGTDPIKVINDFGFRGATYFPIPAGAGGGISLTGFVGDAQWGKIEDQFCQADPSACSTNSCKEWLFPAIDDALPSRPSILQRIKDRRAPSGRPEGVMLDTGGVVSSYKGGVKDGTGRPLAGSTVALMEPEPRIETALDDNPKNDLPWTPYGLILLPVDKKGEFTVERSIIDEIIPSAIGAAIETVPAKTGVDRYPDRGSWEKFMGSLWEKYMDWGNSDTAKTGVGSGKTGGAAQNYETGKSPDASVGERKESAPSTSSPVSGGEVAGAGVTELGANGVFQDIRVQNFGSTMGWGVCAAVGWESTCAGGRPR
jgi:hypothetical protein